MNKLAPVIKRGIVLVPSLVASVFLSACGSGGSDSDPLAAVDETNPLDVMAPADVEAPTEGPGSSEILEIGTPPVPATFDVNNGRTVAIELMEVMDSLLFLSSELPNAVLTSQAGDVTCAGGGTESVTLSGSEIVANFSDCVKIDGLSVSLGGTFTMPVGNSSDAFSGEVSFDEFQASNNGRTVTANGSVTLSLANQMTSATDVDLVINDGQSDTIIGSNSVFDVDRSNGTFDVIMAVNLVLQRFSTESMTMNAGDFVGESANCPTTGSVVLMAADESAVTVSGGEGGGSNVLFSTLTNVDTLNCAEIPSLFSGSTTTDVPATPDVPEQPTFQPPPAPGG